MAIACYTAKGGRGGLGGRVLVAREKGPVERGRADAREAGGKRRRTHFMAKFHSLERELNAQRNGGNNVEHVAR